MPQGTELIKLNPGCLASDFASLVRRLGISAHTKMLSPQSIGVPQKDGSRKTQKEAVGLRGVRLVREHAPCSHSQSPRSAPRPFTQGRREGIASLRGLTIAQAEWPVPDLGLFCT